MKEIEEGLAAAYRDRAACKAALIGQQQVAAKLTLAKTITKVAGLALEVVEPLITWDEGRNRASLILSDREITCSYDGQTFVFLVWGLCRECGGARLGRWQAHVPADFGMPVRHRVCLACQDRAREQRP